MKRILLSDDAVAQVNILRDNNGSYEALKCRIADTVCSLAKMISHGMYLDENNVLKHYVNDAIEAMDLIADYNKLINDLNALRDTDLPRYVLEEPEDDGKSQTYDYAPREGELEAVKMILEERDIKIPGPVELDELMLSEIANISGMPADVLHTMVCSKICQRNK